MKTALITGTTSGIGKAFAEKCAAEGIRVILASRNRQELERQQDDLQRRRRADVRIIAHDLTREDAADAIMARVGSWNLGIDILVNNAGFNTCGPFAETDMQSELDMLCLHIRFVTQLTKLVLPGMAQNRWGRILNVGSTGSFIPTPYDAVYSATKAYIRSFSYALRGECRGTGIKITLLCPGATKTEFARKAQMEHTPLFSFAVMPPEKVVETAYAGMMKGKRLVIPGLHNKLCIFFAQILPAEIVDRLAAYSLKSAEQ